MTATAALKCPKCKKFATAHCKDSKACDLLVCQKCKAYGTQDGNRWRKFNP